MSTGRLTGWKLLGAWCAMALLVTCMWIGALKIGSSVVSALAQWI